MLEKEDVNIIKQIVDGSIDERLRTFEGKIREIVEEAVIQELKPLEEAVRLIVKEEIHSVKFQDEIRTVVREEVAPIKSEMRMGFEKQERMLKSVETMLNNDLIEVMKDTEKIDKRVTQCEDSIKKLAPAMA